MLRTLKLKFNERVRLTFLSWLKKRMPSQDKQTLSHKNIFIFPTTFGVIFLCFSLLLFVLGTNYQNNLIILFSYLMVSTFVTSMLYSFVNLSGITVLAKGQYQSFCNEVTKIPISIYTPKTNYQYQLSFYGQKTTDIQLLINHEMVEVPVSFSERGIKQLPRLKILSHYNYGLFQCWTQLQFNITVVVCPQPLACTANYMNGSCLYDEEKANAHQVKGSGEEFYEFKPYQQGDSISQIAWKHMAKTGEWVTKSYFHTISSETVLFLADMPSTSIELKLRNLCYLILQYHQSGQSYGVNLFDRVIEPGKGKEHLIQCLTALATYGES